METKDRRLRLVAMIEENNGEYEVINFLPDVIVTQPQNGVFGITEIKEYIHIPYTKGISNLTVIVGENGVGKTNLINNIFQLNKEFYFIYETYDFENRYKKYSCYNKNNRYLWLNKSNDGGRQFFSKEEKPIRSIRFSNAIESYTQYSKTQFDLTTTYKLSNQNILESNQKDMANQIDFLFRNRELSSINNFIFKVKDKRIVTQLELNRQNNREFLNYIDYIRTKFEDEDDQIEAIMEFYDTDDNISEYSDYYFSKYDEEFYLEDDGVFLIKDYEQFLIDKYGALLQNDSQYISFLEEKYNISHEKYMRDIEREDIDSIDLRQFILDKNNIFDSINRMLKGYLVHIFCCKDLDNENIEDSFKKFRQIVTDNSIQGKFDFLPKTLKEAMKVFNIENFNHLVLDVAVELIETFKRESDELVFEIKRFTENSYWKDEGVNLEKGFLETVTEGIFTEFESDNYAVELMQAWGEVPIEKRYEYIEAIKSEFLSSASNYFQGSLEIKSDDIILEKEAFLDDIREELLKIIPLEDIKKFEELFDKDLISIKSIYLEYYCDTLWKLIELKNRKELLEKKDRNKFFDIESTDVVLVDILDKLPTGMFKNFESHFLDLISYNKSYIWFINYYNAYNSCDQDQEDILEKLNEKSSIKSMDNLKYLIHYFSDETNALFKLGDEEKLSKFHKIISILQSDFTIEQNQVKFTKINELVSFIKFRWEGLSSGEHSLLNLFGRMFSIVENIGNQEMLLLLDEVDIGLHPEWQRKWISDILPRIIENFNEKSVQIIMTTHSPIMLSDIYSENVIMLKKDKETGNKIIEYADTHHKTTFGQNIHQLFMDSFFLESTKGEYATKVINATIKAIYELNQEYVDLGQIKSKFSEGLKLGELSDLEFKKYLEKIINSIGEKVISKKLKIMFQRINFSHVSAPNVDLSSKMVSELSTDELRKILQEREKTK
ncbi:AAA family ATPase [Streptococcus hillyeri]|uniref:AAA family ATPase n=1 Tax=Streptococcus hillyeri TaxID=2282420 RepID=UPI0034E1AEFF